MNDHFSLQQRSDVITGPHSPILDNYVYVANIMTCREQFATYVRADYEKWARVAREANIVLE